MQEALRVLNQLQAEGFIADYAIAGGIASLFYIEPLLTFDLDVFAVIPEPPERLDILSPLYTRLKEMGYSAVGPHVKIGVMPVQILLPPSPLEEDAVRNAAARTFEGIPVKVLRPEYLIAIYLLVGRPKDRIRIGMLLTQTEIDHALLDSLIAKYGLEKPWTEFQKSRT